jgi:hypothetical protein
MYLSNLFVETNWQANGYDENSDRNLHNAQKLNCIWSHKMQNSVTISCMLKFSKISGVFQEHINRARTNELLQGEKSEESDRLKATKSIMIGLAAVTSLLHSSVSG